MDSIVVDGITFTGSPCKKHTATWNGVMLTAGERTWAHLFATQEWLDEHHPGHYIHVVQGAYNTGVRLSAGTHDGDGTVDVYVINRRTGRKVWVRGQRWLRTCGWAAWWRHAGSWAMPSAWHHHMNSLGCAESGCPVGVFIPGQNRDYLAKPPRDGLAGHARDYSWHPSDIEATVFDFHQWLTDQEENMSSPKNWDAADWAAFDKHVTADAESVLKKIRPSNGRSLAESLVLVARKVGVPDKSKS